MPSAKSSTSPTLAYGVLACVAVAFAPLMFFHLQGLWAEEYYQYYPFVIAAVCWFMWERWSYAEPTTDSGKVSAVGYFLVTSGLLLLAFATLIWSPWLASFAFVTFMGAVAIQIYRQHGRITNQFGIWCLLWLLVPIPLQFDHRFVVKLQRLSSRFSGQVLDILRIDHLMDGTVLQLPDKQFFVDEACSGIVSVMSVIASGAIFVVWRNRTLFHVIAVLAMGVLWAVVMNVGRITVIAFAHAWWNIDLSVGWQHEVIGLALFSMTFIALVSTDSLISFLTDPISKPIAEREAPSNALVTLWNRLVTSFDPQRSLDVGLGVGTASTAGETSPRGLTTRFSFGLSALCLVLAGLQVFVLSRGYRDPESPVELARSIDTNLLPDSVGDWEKTGFETIERESGNEFGNYSKQFLYRHKPTNTVATVSLDFPYRGGWHELSVCYRNFGWPMKDRVVQELPLAGSNEIWTVVNADYEKPDGQFGYLAFSGTNGTGDLLEPPSALVLWRPWFRLRRRLLHRISPRFFQFQAWLNANAEISPETKDDVMELFLELRPHVRHRLQQGVVADT